MLELQDGTMTNSQVKIQDEIKLHDQKNKTVNANSMEVMWRT